jgi:hypothetical protein
LKFSEFNIGDRKAYNMLSPHKYLTRTEGKNLKIILQPWTQNLTEGEVKKSETQGRTNSFV